MVFIQEITLWLTMKCLVVLTLLAVSRATSTGDKSIQINENGIVIDGANGRRIEITRPTGWPGQKNIDITVNGPGGTIKRIRFNDQNEVVDQDPRSYVEYGEDFTRSKRSKTELRKPSQGEVLQDILRSYQGVVDSASYEKLLKRLEKSVQKGEISTDVYQLFRDFEQISQDPRTKLYDVGYYPGQNYYGGEGQDYRGYNYVYGQQGLRPDSWTQLQQQIQQEIQKRQALQTLQTKYGQQYGRQPIGQYQGRVPLYQNRYQYPVYQQFYGQQYDSQPEYQRGFERVGLSQGRLPYYQDRFVYPEYRQYYERIPYGLRWALFGRRPYVGQNYGEQREVEGVRDVYDNDYDREQGYGFRGTQYGDYKEEGRSLYPTWRDYLLGGNEGTQQYAQRYVGVYPYLYGKYYQREYPQGFGYRQGFENLVY